jgi:predicted homoserine dehydrogenase-like protein
MTSLSTKLAEREASGKPIQIGLIGAGKFGSMLYVPTVMPREHHASIDSL